MSNEEKSFPKTSINWVIRIYGNTSSSLDKIRILENWVFTFFLHKNKLIMKKHNIKKLEVKLKSCKDIDLSEISMDDVDELSEIKISRKKSKEEKILDFISKTKNAYIFKVNGKLVKLEFADNVKDGEDAIINVIKNIYKWFNERFD